MITVELEHFSLDKICDSGQCFRMRKLGDGHFSMVAGDQYLEMHQKNGIVDFLLLSGVHGINIWVPQ